jgi:hypothetical protein
VEVGELGGLRAAGVEHDQRSSLISSDLLQSGARVRDAVRLPRVLADEDGDLGMLDVAAVVGADDPGIHPRLARLLLRERVGPVAHAERGARRPRVGTAKVVPLPAAAVIEDRRAPVSVPDASEAGGHLSDGRVPVDGFVRAVRATPHWRGEPVPSVLVVVEPQGFFARVALRCRVGLVASDALEGASVLTEADLDPAVALAEDASCRLPLRRRRRLCQLRHITDPRLVRCVTQLVASTLVA